MFKTVVFRMSKKDNSFLNYELCNEKKEMCTEQELAEKISQYNSNEELGYYYLNLENVSKDILVEAFMRKPKQAPADTIIDEFRDEVDRIKDSVNDLENYLDTLKETLVEFKKETPCDNK